MTPERFTAVGKRLFGLSTGYGWQAEMHRQTGCPSRTIEAWAAGTNPIPAVVAWALDKIDTQRGDHP